MFAIAIPGIAIPGGTRRRLPAQQRVEQLHAPRHGAVVGRPEPEAHELQEIPADLIGRRDAAAVPAVADRDRPRDGGRIAQRLLRSGADVVIRHAVGEPQRRIVRGDPVLDLRIPEIGKRSREGCGGFIEELGARHQGGDAHGQRERIESGILLPPVLRAGRPGSRDEAERPADHVGHLDSAQLPAIGQRRREQHRKRRLVELNSLPEFLSAEPLILVPMPVRVLSRDEVLQDLARLFDASQREQRAAALNQVARPDQMVSAAVVACIAPRHAQARDHGTRENLVLMHAEHHGRYGELLDQIGRQLGRRRECGHSIRMPDAPHLDMTRPADIERLQRSRYRQGGRGARTAAEAERQYRPPRQLAEQCHVARTCRPVFPGHCAVLRKILPAVARAHEARAEAAPGIALQAVHGGQRQRKGTLVGPKNLSVVVPRGFRVVVAAGAAQVRRQQRIGSQFLVAIEFDFHEQHIANGRWRDAQGQLKARVFVHDPHGRHAGARRLEPVGVHPLDLDPEPLAVRHDETEVADLRDVDTRVIDLVDDSAADGEPDSGGAERATHDFLGAVRPRRVDARHARSRRPAVRDPVLGHGSIRPVRRHAHP